MVKTFIYGETTTNGLNIHWIDSETLKREIEEIEFYDYFYIKIDDFYQIKEDLKKQWKSCLRAVVEVKAKNEYNEDDVFAKIILKDNTKKPFLNQWLVDENHINTYEADLDTTKRYSIDNYKTLKYNILDSPYLFYDIEIDDRNTFKYDAQNRIIPESTILSCAAIDFRGNKFFLINEDSTNPECEKKLLLQIREIFMKYSVVSGWNSFVFDDTYLEGRCKIHALEDFTKSVNKIDFMHSYKKFRIEQSLDSYSLDNVSKIELGEGKIDIKKGGGRLYNLYLTDKKKLEEYNIMDTELLYRMNKKLKFIELHLMTAHKGMCRVELTKYNIGSNDYFVLMKCKDKNLIAPSNPNKEEKERRRAIGGIGGGYTRGIPGLYKYVATYDFSSLYPSLEITYNISPETFVRNVTIKEEAKYLEEKDKGILVLDDYESLKQYCIENNYIYTPSDLTYVAKQGREIYHPYRLYKGDEIGLLPSIMIELLEDRARIKKAMKTMDRNSVEYDSAYIEQLALKYMLNSNYGLNALPSYRFFRYDVADSITTSGRVNTKRVRKFAEDNGFFVIYSDTDSIGITIPEKTSFEDAKIRFAEFDKKLVEFIDETLKDTNNNVYKREDKYGVHNHRLILEWEKTFKVLLYKRKKRYAGLIQYPNGDEVIDITGLRSTQMNVMASKLQEEFLEDVLSDRFDKDIWKEKIDKLYDDCFNMKIEAENLIISKKFTERAANQKAPRAHTLLAERLIEQGEDIAVGDKIKYIVKEYKPKQIAVTIDEFNKEKIYPAEYYWEIFVNPIVSLMSIIKNVDVFEIVKIPELIKLETKLKKEQDDSKKIKLMERIHKKKEELTGIDVDEQEDQDFLFNIDD